MNDDSREGSMAFQLGENKAAVSYLVRSQSRMEKDIVEINAALRSIQNTLAEKKGEQRVTAYIASGVGAGAMFVFTLIAKKFGLGS